MFIRRKKRVVEEEVTEIVTDGKSFEPFMKQLQEKQKQEKREEREEIEWPELQEKLQRKRREWMKYEQNRRQSFEPGWLNRFQFDVGVAQQLAKAGFYCSRGYTECFSCGLWKPSYFWREGIDPETVHREESPNCEFNTGQSDNVPIEMWMKYEQNRLDSFPSRWLHRHQFDISVVQHLAKAEFYAWGRNTECFSCEHSSFWRKRIDPEVVHRKESPDCTFITGQSDNVPIDGGMRYEQNRLDSFDSRWSHRHQLEVSVAQHLAKAGFLHWGDAITCFSCGLWKPSYFWRKGIDPETVHREESPDCEFITGQSDNVPRNAKKQNKIEFINKPSLSGVSEPDKPQEEEVYKLEPLKDKSQNQIKIDTGPSKPQIQPERKTNEKNTKTNKNIQTEPRTGSGRKSKESGSKRQAPERRNDILITSSLPDEHFISNKNHTAHNVHQRSAAFTRSSSSDVRVEKLTSGRDTKAGTSTTHREVEKKSASESIKQKTVSATTSRSSTVKRNKSVTSLRRHQEDLTSETNRDVTHPVNSESDVRRVNPDTTHRKHFTSEIPCLTVSSDKTFKSSVHFLVEHCKLKRRKWLNKGTP